MIFRTQKLQELKNFEFQASNPEIHSIKQSVLKQIWPESSHLHFCQTIQSIALKWMNQFVNLIEKWLSQASSKYLIKLTDSKIVKNVQEKEKLRQYVFNLSKYIESMEYPLITSINNIHSLYLKFPSDELIQQPKRSIQNQSISLESSPMQKKKSLSIQSFISNIPTKSRSTSKSRKLSFFKNNTSPNPNVFQTFCKDSKKMNQNLNSTVKKVKKDLPFTKTTTASTFKSGSNQNNQKQNFMTSTPAKVNELKQKLQQRLSNSCSSTFFNHIVAEQSLLRQQSFLEQNSTSEKKQSSGLEDSSIKKQLQDDLKKSILEELDKKEKQNYEHLLKDIQNKLSSKFDNLLQGILKQQKSSETCSTKNQNLMKANSFKEITQNSQSKTIQDKENSLKSQQFGSDSSNVKKCQIQSLNFEKKMVKQPSICNMIKQNNQSKQPLYQAEPIEELKSVEVKRDSKVNSSVIVQKDASKIIKSKNKPICTPKQTKESFVEAKVIAQKINKSSEKPKHYNNPIDQNDSIDSIEIIDSRYNSNGVAKANISQHIEIGQPKIESNVKKEDNFYMKRIKELKIKMENSFKNYKIACNKLVIPVNQTFLLLFSTCYQQFCEFNSFTLSSQQITETLSKYNSKDEIKSKLPENNQKFLVDSLNKIEKMVNLNCPAEKKAKILEYTQKCIECIENIFFEKPDLKLNNEAHINKKLKQIKSALTISINQ